MKKEKNRKKKQKYRANSKNKERELESERKSYSKSTKKKNDKKKYYQEVTKKKLEARKYDSTFNDAEYRRSIRFGPIFVCVCCHGGLFEDNVKKDSKKLKNKIQPDILDSFCMFGGDFKNTLTMGNFYI